MIGVGDKVVCIADNWLNKEGKKGIGPKKNEIYIVREITHKFDFPCFRFDEFKDYYDVADFRKLHDDTVKNILKLMAERPVIIN